MYGWFPKAHRYFQMSRLSRSGALSVEAQFAETMLLLTINHQSLIATKANRIVRAAQGRPVMELALEGRKDMTERYMARGPLI